MNQAIAKVLEAICLERDDETYSASFRAADELLAAYGANAMLLCRTTDQVKHSQC